MDTIVSGARHRLGFVHDCARIAVVAARRAALARSLAGVPGGSGAHLVRGASRRAAVGRELSTGACRGERGYGGGYRLGCGTHRGSCVCREHAGSYRRFAGHWTDCLLYTSDAADERSSVDLGGRRIIKKKKKKM